jgi:hypothetical protein
MGGCEPLRIIGSLGTQVNYRPDFVLPQALDIIQH